MQFTVEAVRALKGAPLSILFIMLMNNQPLSASYLESMTGYSDKSVQAGLRTLNEYGYVTRNNRYNWQLAKDVIALPLMYPTSAQPLEINSQPEHGPQDISDGLTNGQRDTEKFRVGEIPCRRNSVSSIDSWIVNDKDINLINQLPTYGAADTEKFRVDEPSLPGMTPDERDETTEKYRILEDYAINEPKRSKIAKNSHYSLRSVAYHCATSESTGQMIYRIEHNWRVPASWKAHWKQVPRYEVVDAEPAHPVPDALAESIDMARETLGDHWPRMMSALQDLLPKHEFDTWCKSMLPVSVSTETVTLRVANDYVAGWIRKNVAVFIQDQLGLQVEVIS